jgi:hypothetical protein
VLFKPLENGYVREAEGSATFQNATTAPVSAAAGSNERMISIVAAANTLAATSLVLRFVCFCNLEIVVDAEHARRHISLHAGDGEIARVVDCPFQCDVPILDDDVNGVPPDWGIVRDA